MNAFQIASNHATKLQFAIQIPPADRDALVRQANQYRTTEHAYRNNNVQQVNLNHIEIWT